MIIKLINNWYNDHIADGDEDLEDYIIMDDYESSVEIKDNNTLIFCGYCDGHYANIEPSDEVEDLIESFFIRARVGRFLFGY